MENDITREIDRLRRRVREQDAVYDSLSVSFDDLKQKYHDLADVSYFKNASLAAANQWAEALRKEVDRLKAELAEARDTAKKYGARLRCHGYTTKDLAAALKAGAVEE